MRRLVIGLAVLASCTTASPGRAGDSSSSSATTATIASTTTTAAATSTVLSTVGPGLVGPSVPWLDHPVGATDLFEFAHTLPTSVATAEPCPLSALNVLPFAQGAMGSIYGVLWVRNVGSPLCQLQGVPVVRLINGAGAVVSETDPARVAADKSPPVVLVQNSWTRADLGYLANDLCGGHESSSLRFRWPGAEISVAFAVGRPFELSACPGMSEPPTSKPAKLDVSAFTLIDNTTYDPFTPLRNLRAELRAPASVRAGDTLRYSVLLTNTTMPVANDRSTDTALNNTDCPVYRESVARDLVQELHAPAAVAQDLLNCGNGIVIPADETVEFEMQLAIPATAPTGLTTITWRTTEPPGITATATINITN